MCNFLAGFYLPDTDASALDSILNFHKFSFKIVNP
jgi:hypothetical protein